MRSAPSRRFCVAGPHYPDGIDWPANVARLSHVAPADHPDFHAASRTTLNVARAEIIRAGHGPSVRLFEAAACGTPIGSDGWDGMDTLFRPGREIALADTAAEVLAVLDQPDAARRAMAAAARDLVLARHSAAHRVAHSALMSSTSEIYGDPEVHPQLEGYWGNVDSTGPRACYDKGKRVAEALCFDYDRAGRAQVRAARIFNTYGPYMRPDDGRVVSNVITQALAGRHITVCGDGGQTRSFCCVADRMDGLRRLMAHDTQPGPVDLGNPVELTVAELVGRVLAMTGSASREVRRPLPVDDPHRRRPDTSHAEAVLGWQSRTGLEEGLRATIAWFSGAMPQNA